MTTSDKIVKATVGASLGTVLVENSPDILILLEALRDENEVVDFQIVEMNTPATHFITHSQEDTTGSLMHTSTHNPLLSLYDKYVQALNTHTPVEDEIVHDGKTYHYLLLPTGERVAVVLKDITAWRVAQSVKQKRLAGGIGHDFGNLLTAIQGYTAMALDEKPTGSLLSYLNSVQKASQQAAALNRQLLIFADKQRSLAKAVSLNDVIEESKAQLEREVGTGIQLGFHLSEDLWKAQIDSTLFEQLLLNFAHYAKSTTQEQGQFIITTQNLLVTSKDKESSTSLPPMGEYILLELSTTGKSISPELQSSLFDPYFTEKPSEKGAGLGLAVCQNIVVQSGGKIRVSNKTGNGTSFLIYLPRAIEVGATLPTPMRAEPLPYEGTETILVVDDEPSLLTLITHILEAKGYSVLQALSAEQALDIVGRYRGQIDMLVTDMMMPGITGKQLSERLQKECPTLPTLYVSGYTANHLAYQGSQIDTVNLLPKPFHAVDLLKRVRQELDTVLGGRALNKPQRI